MAAIAGGIVAACGGSSSTTPVLPNLTSPHLSYSPTAAPNVHPLICIQGVDLEPERELIAAQKITEAMQRVREHEFWELVHGKNVPPNIVLGCAAPSAFDGNGNYLGFVTGMPAPLENRDNLQIYVYPDPRLSKQPVRVVYERKLCGGDVCWFEGNSLYVMPSDMCDSDLLVTALLQSIHLLGQFEEPAVFIEPTQTPREPVVDYGQTVTPYPERSQTPTPTPRLACF